ncbi:MAG: glycoside hydrolase family 2 TIM barrel-domain containing protein [Rikenellaceae bacterium]
MIAKKYFPLLALFLMFSFGTFARTEFVSYDIKELAKQDKRAENKHYHALEFTQTKEGEKTIFNSTLDLTINNLDRETFLRMEGLPTFTLFINNRAVSSGSDSKQLSEFNITPQVTNGKNSIRIEYTPDENIERFEAEKQNFTLKNCYVHSQPKVRIKDYKVYFTADSLSKNDAIINIEVTLSNSYNSTEAPMLGYDIYTPQGKQCYYNLRELKINAQSEDIIIFSDKIANVQQNPWSTSSPKLYNIVLYLRKGDVISEYINLNIGYKDFSINKDSKLVATKYNAIKDAKTSQNELAKLKKQGINTLSVSHPQPYWFYDLCDKMGFMVIDQANINCEFERDNLKRGGTPSNDPKVQDLYLERVEKLYARGKNHTCIVAFSLGGESGNGINMYKAYKLLKQLDPSRPALYPDAKGEWNSDFEFPTLK